MQGVPGVAVMSMARIMKESKVVDVVVVMHVKTCLRL
jgi:hypothetical protein